MFHSIFSFDMDTLTNDGVLGTISMLIGPQKRRFGPFCTTMGGILYACCVWFPHSVARLSLRCLAEGNRIFDLDQLHVF